jgi:hypothetical protein
MEFYNEKLSLNIEVKLLFSAEEYENRTAAAIE